MYNRLKIPMKMAEFLSDTGCEVILMDSNSTYPKLLEWYDKCPYKVHRFNINYRERIYWDSKLFNMYNDDYYVVTDHDLDLTEIPSDYISKLIEGLDGNPNITKCGLSLDIDNLPENTYTREVKNFEGKYWLNQDNMGNYIAGVDTTFAVYDKRRQGVDWDYGDRFYYATRLPKPYTAKHIPWYLTKESLSNDTEELYYHIHCTNQWSSIYKREFNIIL